MTKRFYKHKLLLDENFPVRSYFPKLNNRYDLKHVSADLGLSSIPDSQVYELAQTEGRIVVTYNIKDFISLVENDTESGLIGVSPSLQPDQVDKKLTALLNKSTKKSLLGKLTVITSDAEK
jgi:hypothetical protein